jgi:hypothetical protein
MEFSFAFCEKRSITVRRKSWNLIFAAGRLNDPSVLGGLTLQTPDASPGADGAALVAGRRVCQFNTANTGQPLLTTRSPVAYPW